MMYHTDREGMIAEAQKSLAKYEPGSVEYRLIQGALKELRRKPNFNPNTLPIDSTHNPLLEGRLD